MLVKIERSFYRPWRVHICYRALQILSFSSVFSQINKTLDFKNLISVLTWMILSKIFIIIDFIHFLVLVLVSIMYYNPDPASFRTYGIDFDVDPFWTWKDVNLILSLIYYLYWDLENISNDFDEIYGVFET